MKKSILFLLVLTLTITTVCSFSVSAAEGDSPDYVLEGSFDYRLEKVTSFHYRSGLPYTYGSAGVNFTSDSYQVWFNSMNRVNVNSLFYVMPIDFAGFEIKKGRSYFFRLPMISSSGVNPVCSSISVAFCTGMSTDSEGRLVFEPRLEFADSHSLEWVTTAHDFEFTADFDLVPKYMVVRFNFSSFVASANPVLSLGIAAWCAGLAIGLFKRLV